MGSSTEKLARPRLYILAGDGAVEEMKILVDIWHPKQVHLFKKLIKYFIKNGHIVVTVSRDKDVINSLLTRYDIPFESLTHAGNNLYGMLIELILRDLKIFKLYKRYKFDIGIGTSPSIAHLSKITPMRSYFFTDDDDEVVPLIAMVTHPFATKIINPKCLKYKKWQNKRITYESYEELAYLHPNNFSPSQDIYDYLKLKKDEAFFVIRLSALKAHHDIGIQGMNKEMLIKLINYLKPSGHVFITTEGDILPEFAKYQMKIPPHKMHDALYYAKMVFADGQTMTAESAVLGTPAIRYNSFVGRISYLEELEHKYQLTYGFKPGQEKEMFSKIKELLSLEDLDSIWQRRRRQMLSEKVDLNQWMINFFENINNKLQK